MKIKKMIPLATGSLLILVLCMSACEKAYLEKHYVGDFKFTNVAEHVNDYTLVTTRDTAISDGTIAYEKETLIMTKESGLRFIFRDFNFFVCVDDGELVNQSIVNDLATIEGEFLSDDEVVFTYKPFTIFSDSVTTTYHVTGLRL